MVSDKRVCRVSMVKKAKSQHKNIFSVCLLSENGPSRILVQVMICFVLVVQFQVMVNKSLKHKDLINKSFNKFIL